MLQSFLMSLFFIFCIWVNTPMLAQEGKGRFQKSFCCWEILQPENECSTNWRGHFLALRLDSMWCFLKWLHPFHHPLPHRSPDHTVQSSSWNDASLTWLGIIQDSCCDQSRFLNRSRWSSVIWICIPPMICAPLLLLRAISLLYSAACFSPACT